MGNFGNLYERKLTYDNNGVHDDENGILQLRVKTDKKFGFNKQF